MKLAIVQMVLGGLLVVDCLCYFLMWFYPGAWSSPVVLFALPALSLAVLGCGVAQFLKARK